MLFDHINNIFQVQLFAPIEWDNTAASARQPTWIWASHYHRFSPLFSFSQFGFQNLKRERDKKTHKMREPFELYTFFCVCWACILASRRLPLFYSNKVSIDFYFFFFNPEVWWSKSSIGRTPLPRLPLKKHIEKKSMGGVPVDNRFQWHKEATSFSWFFF